MGTAMQKTKALTLALGVALTATMGLMAPAELVAKQASQKENVYVPFEQFTLPNGLRVIVHTDRKAPVVAVNIWYHVGSKDEEPGRTGFAHLFEHLMFQGSENHDGEFFDPFEQVGATNMNGTTDNDRTNYFQNVPTTALDMALWMESDRMGHLLGAVTQEALDEQRGVVQNEKRQGENQPYGRVWNTLAEQSYPKGHPYSWSVIGSMADLNAAKLEDVQRWFKTWYGPNNAVLVLAGDIDLATAKKKVAKYFAHIPAGPDMAQPAENIAKRDESKRVEMTDRVPQARVVMAWNTPQSGSPEVVDLSVLAQILAGSRSSRLDKRLVYKDKLVDSVSAYSFGQQLSGLFMIQANVKAGADVAQVEKAIHEELNSLLKDGPSADELVRARTVFKAGFVRSIERIGGFGGKADALAECAVFTGDPGCYRKDLARLEALGTAQVLATAQKWLRSGDLTLVVNPGDKPGDVVDVSTAQEGYVSPELPAVAKKYKTSKSTVDRSKGVPQTTEFPQLSFPKLQRTTLSNGLSVIVAERKGIPVVQMSMEIGSGYTADQGRKLGTASFTMSMLDEGTKSYDSIAFSERAASLGANIGAGASLDGGNVYLSALSEQLAPSMDLFAEVVLAPSFADADIERVRAQWIAGIKQEKARPNSLAQRLLPPLMYGKDHPYAIPFSGTGTEASIMSLSREDLVAFHRDHLRPDNATLIVVGDTSLEKILPEIEKRFGQWQKPDAALAAPVIAHSDVQKEPRVFLVDQPGAIQATILAGQLVPSTMDERALEFEIANSVLGGEFSSRLNMNLREDKSWAYGAYSFVQSAKGQRPWIAFAPVQIDKTADSIKELHREITEFATGVNPATDAEVAKIQATEVRGLPGSYETANAVLGAIGGIVRYQRSDDYVIERQQRIEALTADQVRANSNTINPQALTWVVVGDLSKIEEPVRALNLGKIQIIDADGNPAEPAAAKK